MHKILLKNKYHVYDYDNVNLTKNLIKFINI